MPAVIRTYYKTTELTDEQLSENVMRASNQDEKIYKLFKTFGTMTRWDAYDLYNELVGTILPSSVGRTIVSLLNKGVIVEGEQVDGPMGSPVSLYTIIDNAPDDISNIRVNKTRYIKTKIIYKQDETGENIVDIEAMYDEFEQQMYTIV